MEKEKIKAKLLESNIKPTLQRIIIYGILEKEKCKHFSSEGIYKKISKEFSEISRATIYNTIKIFKENGLIRTIKTDTLEKIYDFNLMPHGHFICEKCGKIKDIPLNIENIKKNTKDFNEEIRSIEITAKGLCNECKGTKK